MIQNTPTPSMRHPNSPPDHKSNASENLWHAINIILVIAGIAAIFMLFTNAVPLVQMGWLKELGKKSRYVRLAGISITIFSVLMFAVWWKLRAVFERSVWAKFWQSASRIPLRYTATAFFLTYAAIMTAVGFERHLALETRAFDLGIFAQAVWNTIQGNFLFSSIKENICLLGDHVSPILLLTAPFYAIWPDPRMLILLQAIASASSVIPLALIARDKLKDRSLVLIFLLLYFFFQPMRAALHEDFHPEVLAEPFLWWAFLFLERGMPVRFLLCLAVAITGKENFLGISFMLGLYAFLFKKMRVLGATVMSVSIGLFIWETKWLIPHLTGAKYFYGSNYARALSDPANGLFRKLVDPESLEYAFKVFLTFLFLPFLHFSTFLLTLPVFLQNLLSVNGSMRSFNYHYFTGLTPFLFISTIYSFAQLKDRRGWFQTYALPAGFLLLAIGLLRSGPSEYYFYWQIHSHRNPHTEMIREKLRQIPPGVTVLTHNGFIPQLCNRKHVYQFNYNRIPGKRDFVKKYGADYVIWDQMFWEPDTQPLAEALSDMKSEGFSVQFQQDGFYVLQKKS